jgi:hypothetical protein
MKNRLIASLVVFAALALGYGRNVYAHEGHVSTVIGTVTMAATDHLMLKDRQNKEVTLRVTKDTKVKATPAVKVENIKAGTRVVVTTVEEKDKTLTATMIEVGKSTSPAK